MHETQTPSPSCEDSHVSGGSQAQETEHRPLRQRSEVGRRQKNVRTVYETTAERGRKKPHARKENHNVTPPDAWQNGRHQQDKE